MAGHGRPADRRPCAAGCRSARIARLGRLAPFSRVRELRCAAVVQLRALLCPQRGAARRSRSGARSTMIWILAGAGSILLGVVVYDVTQRRHAILRNFPIIGHFRYLLEAVGPELRQYIVTGNDEERPFSRDERRWIYASSKHQN